MPVAQAAGQTAVAAQETASAPVMPMEESPEASKSCYEFMLMRPRDQRAVAVQARLRQADQMAAALDSRTFTVNLVGDHANILSLQFPVVWPAPQSYTDRVSTVIEDYFSVPDIQDYLCNSGFQQVRLIARGLNDKRLHPVWTAYVTSEGLVKLTALE